MVARRVRDVARDLRQRCANQDRELPEFLYGFKWGRAVGVMLAVIRT